jgi:predicted Zn-dependent protease
VEIVNAPPERAVPQPQPAATAIDPRRIAQLRRRVAASSTRDELVQLLDEADALARRHDGSRAAQLLAAEIAYLLSDWQRSISYFASAGELRAGEEHLAFYLAVGLYESGQPGAAAEVLQPVASRLERTAFVGGYLELILGAGAAEAPPPGG